MVSFTAILSLGLSLFANSAYCDTFIKPPQDYNRTKFGRDWRENLRYNAGDKISIEWKRSHIYGVDLSLWQLDGETLHGEKLDATQTEWKAEYNVSGGSIAGQDSVYYFQLMSKSDSYGFLANSITFNVSAPGTDEKESQTVIPTTTEESSTTKPTTEHSSTTAAASEETDATSDSNLSRGKTAGVACGATIGSILFLGGAGWLL
ncbi:hypothetical protein FGRMN_4150 [Fusarium graminum]|nr:hypothetical protein FGRMN_4150 [Fusarium graminum]